MDASSKYKDPVSPHVTAAVTSIIPLVFDAFMFSLAASLLPWPLAPAGAAVAFVHEEELAV